MGNFHVSRKRRVGLISENFAWTRRKCHRLASIDEMPWPLYNSNKAHLNNGQSITRLKKGEG